jgi:diguanylate cyclase (GGDEF)-like protein/PAS domain S-box-containing protein
MQNEIDDFLGIVETNNEGVITSCNDLYCKQSGFHKDELIGAPVSLLKSGYHSESFYADLWGTLLKGEVWNGQLHNKRKDGTDYWIKAKIIPKTDNANKINSFIEYSIDITEFKETSLKYQNIIDSTSDIIYILNSNGVFTFVSPSWEDLLGHSVDEVLNHVFTPFVHPDDVPTCMNYLERTLKNKLKKNESVTYRVFHKDGSIRYHRSKASLLRIMEDSFEFLGVASDITELKNKEKEIIKKNQQLEQLATHDFLTGIYNRKKADEYIENVLYDNERYKEPSGIILYDIDHFKQVNDTYGHQVGDSVLVELSQLVSNNIRQTDFFARWGGEEFLIICKNADSKHLNLLAENLRQIIKQHVFSIVGNITVCFGITECKVGDTGQAVLNRADKALYKAKELGRDKIIVAGNSGLI